jgi:hypothetical protein
MSDLIALPTDGTFSDAQCHLSSYLGNQLLENIQSDYDDARGVTILCGHWANETFPDNGTNSFKSSTAMINNTSEHITTLKSACFVPGNHTNCEFWFVGIADTSYQDAEARITVSDKPHFENLTIPTSGASVGTAATELVELDSSITDITDTTNTRYLTTVEGIKRDEDGMIYVTVSFKNCRIAGIGATMCK